MRAASRTPCEKRFRSAVAGNFPIAASVLTQASSKMRGISAAEMGSRDLVLATSHLHQVANTICCCIRRREQDWISGSGVARCNGPRLVTEQRRNCQVAVSEVSGDAGEAMPKDVRRDVGG